MGKWPSFVGSTLVVAFALTATATAGGCGGLALVDNREGGPDLTPPVPPAPTRQPPTPPPSRPPPPQVEDAEAPIGCPTTGTIDATLLPYKSPFVSMGACTAGDLAALVTYVDNNGTFPGWKTSVPVACAACIFGKETEATWKPMLEDASGTTLAQMNVGGCIAVASGSDACGKAYQQWYSCRPEACVGCPDGDSALLQKCLSAASKGPCKKAFDGVTAVCGDLVIADAETKCDGNKFVFEGPIRAQCIGL